MFVNVGYFLLAQLFANSLKSNSDLVFIGVLETDAFSSGIIWIAITSAFLHFNFIHFTFNILAYINISRIIVQFYGNHFLFFAYIFSAIGGSLLTVIIALVTGVDSATVGASGAIFGLAGILIGGVIKKKVRGYGLPFSVSEILLPIGLALVIGFVPGFNINNWAHLGGLTVGLIIGFFLKNESGEFKTMKDFKLESIFFNIAFIIFVFSFFLLIFNAFNTLFLI